MLCYRRIEETFTMSGEYPIGTACLLSVIKFYDGDVSPRLLTGWCDTGEKVVTLTGIWQAALRAGFDAKVCMMTQDRIRYMETPAILLFKDELGKVDFVVYYGFDGHRFLIGEPSWGLMQYWPEEMEAMWMEGISLVLFPAPDFHRICRNR